MKRWKKSAALLLALCLAASLCACGGGNEPAPEPEPAHTESAPAPAPAEDVPQEPYAPEPEEEFVEPEPEPEPEVKGLIILDTELNQRGISFTQSGCTIYSLDPDTGETAVIADFACKIGIDFGDYFYIVSGTFPASSFSDDYSKLAVTKVFNANNERHAGWLDQNGNFFDVTESLGQQSKSDFDTPVHYNAVGFVDGNFGFSNIPAKSITADFYYVPMDNIVSGAVQAGDVRKNGRPYNEEGALLMGKYTGEYYPHEVTAWIDDTHAIVNHQDSLNKEYNSFIVDTAAQAATAYIPGDSRENWNGRSSPDGTKIAFLSAPKTISTAVPIDLYITSLEDGSPVKVENHPFSFAHIDAPFEAGNCTLLDWK